MKRKLFLHLMVRRGKRHQRTDKLGLLPAYNHRKQLVPGNLYHRIRAKFLFYRPCQPSLRKLSPIKKGEPPPVLTADCISLYGSVKNSWKVTSIKKCPKPLGILISLGYRAFIFHSEQLLRVICHSGLSDHVDLNLSRIFQGFFDLLGNIARQ
mgnify:CR=1 FL=1